MLQFYLKASPEAMFSYMNGISTVLPGAVLAICRIKSVGHSLGILVVINPFKWLRNTVLTAVVVAAGFNFKRLRCFLMQCLYSRESGPLNLSGPLCDCKSFQKA